MNLPRPLLRPALRHLLRRPFDKRRGGGAAAVATLPQSASIVFNMKADSLALADGASVTSWTDSTANALNFTGTGTFKTSQLGGKPCVRFSGGPYMTATRAGTALDTAMSSRTCSVLIVAKSQGSNSFGCMFGSNVGSDSCFFVIDGAQNASSIGRFDGNITTCAPGVDASSMFVMTHVSQNANFYGGSGSGQERTFLNGTCVSSKTTAAPAPNQTTFAIGAVSNGALPAAVDIFDIVVWDRLLTPTEVLQATNFYYNKYSQTKPWAAVSNFTIFDGNSITAGVGSSNVAGSYPYKSAQSLGLTYGQWSNLGVGGITMTNMVVKLAEWNGIGTLLSKGMRVAADEYFNERVTNPATLQAALSAYCSAVRGYANTKLALGTSTSSVFDPETNRDQYNTFIVNNSATLANARVDLHLNANIGVSGAAATDGNVTYFSDGVHLKDAGYTVKAGLMTTGLSSIP